MTERNPPQPHEPDSLEQAPSTANVIAPSEPATDDTRQAPPTGLAFIVITAAIVVGTYGLGKFSAIVAPAFFALTLLLTVAPLRTWLRRKRLPGWLASTISLLLLYIVLFGLITALGLSLAELTNILPTYTAKFQALYQDALALLAQFGINVADLKAMLGSVDLGKVAGIAQSALSSLSSASSQVVFLAIVLAFLIVDTGEVRGRMQILADRRPHLANALADFSVRVRRYWAVNTIFGLIVAVMDVIALAIIGVPLAIVWGVVAFVTNYIPNIGFLLGVIPPALLALLDGGPVQALVVVIVYSAINFIMQSVIQPKFTGDAVGLNTTITFVSLVFWTAVVGPVGAILAVPLTLFFKSLLVDSDPRMHWMNVFLRAKDTEDEQLDHETADSTSGDRVSAGSTSAATVSADTRATAGSAGGATVDHTTTRSEAPRG